MKSKIIEYTDITMEEAMDRVSFMEVLQEESKRRLDIKCSYQLVVSPHGELQCTLIVTDGRDKENRS